MPETICNRIPSSTVTPSATVQASHSQTVLWHTVSDMHENNTSGHSKVCISRMKMYLKSMILSKETCMQKIRALLAAVLCLLSFSANAQKLTVCNATAATIDLAINYLRPPPPAWEWRTQGWFAVQSGDCATYELETFGGTKTQYFFYHAKHSTSDHTWPETKTNTASLGCVTPKKFDLAAECESHASEVPFEVIDFGNPIGSREIILQLPRGRPTTLTRDLGKPSEGAPVPQKPKPEPEPTPAPQCTGGRKACGTAYFSQCCSDNCAPPCPGSAGSSTIDPSARPMNQQCFNIKSQFCQDNYKICDSSCYNSFLPGERDSAEFRNCRSACTNTHASCNQRAIVDCR